MPPLDGSKTIITGIGLLCYGIYLASTGDYPQAIQNIILGLGIIFGRQAVQKVQNQVAATQQAVMQVQAQAASVQEAMTTQARVVAQMAAKEPTA